MKSEDSSSLSDLRSFVSSYTSNDEPRIRFAWNGQHGGSFEDENIEIRRRVKQLVLDDIEAAPLELVRDLFVAETECAREAWGINRGVEILAERMLRTDPDRFLEDYLRGKFQSFDTYCGTAFPTDATLAARLLDIVQSRLRQNLPEERRALLIRGEALFRGWL